GRVGATKQGGKGGVVCWRAGRSDRFGAAAQFGLIVNQFCQPGEIAWRRGKRGRPKRPSTQTTLVHGARGIHRYGEGLLGRAPKGPANTQASAGGEFGKVFASVGINSEAAANHNVLEPGGTPRDPDSGGKHPLATSQ